MNKNRSFTETYIEKYNKFVNDEVINLDEVLGRCFVCDKLLSDVELPNRTENQVTCLKDRNHFIEVYAGLFIE